MTVFWLLNLRVKLYVPFYVHRGEKRKINKSSQSVSRQSVCQFYLIYLLLKVYVDSRPGQQDTRIDKVGFNQGLKR